MNKLKYIDLFAGAGGLSEGFICEKFHPIAHVEMDKDAAATLKTRIAFHFLNQKKKVNRYYSYLKNEISRNDLWNFIPPELFHSVINDEITNESIENIFFKIDEQLDSKKVDLILKPA